ncbi:MAG: DUF1559 domain-containing protein [Planctomycetes bacterium]|nr:DUF1559 domain-containing protein [Planctomycetota bacterium]
MRRSAFTLVELLVMITILALLIAILVPSIGHAMMSFRGNRSMNNLRQLGMGIQLYIADNKGHYPAGAYPAPPTPRIRWSDALWPYMSIQEVYLSPLLTDDDRQRMLTPFAHNLDMTWGGYGFNYHYLGNGRHNAAWTEPYNQPFHARTGSMIGAPSRTICIGDTNGTKAEGIDNSGGQTMESPWTKNGVYALDPPLASKDFGSKGCRRVNGGPTGSSNYGYQGGGDGVMKGENGATASTPGDPICRATPAPRNSGKINIVFCDGHTEALDSTELDDFNQDGQVDNGFWNGLGRSDAR